MAKKGRVPRPAPPAFVVDDIDDIGHRTGDIPRSIIDGRFDDATTYGSSDTIHGLPHDDDAVDIATSPNAFDDISEVGSGAIGSTSSLRL